MIDYIYQNEASIRLSLFLGGFGLLALWEWSTPRRELTQVKFKRWLNNFSLVVCSTIILRLVIPTAAVGVAYLVEQKQFGIAHVLELPFWLKMLLTFVLLDFTIYLQHTMFHALPFMWRFHRVHHSDLDCDVTTGLRFHPVEIVLSVLIKIVTIASLGAPVLAVILFEVMLNLMSMFTHSNIRLNHTFERMLRWFIVTPDMHRIHHSTRENEANSNFSFHISLWDRILGTYLAEPQGGQQGMTIGMDQFRESESQGLKGLMFMPFTSGVGGYAINYRDTINADEFSRVNMLVNEQTKSLKQAKEIAEEKSKELQVSVLRLTENEHYQSMLINSMIDGFVTIDQMGVVILFNPAAETIFGYKENEMIGQNVSKLLPESEAIHHDDYLALYKEKDDSHVIGISREIEGRRKDGSLFPVDIALSDVRIKGERRFTAVVRDISVRKEFENKIILSKENAEKANRAKSEFINSMSHELRTPLNAIIGYSDLIAMQQNLDPVLKEEIEYVRRAGGDLLALVENVLDLSHIEEGKVKLVLEEFHMSELLDECHALVKPLAEKSGIQLNIKLNSHSTIVRADRGRLKQVLLNLLSNAVKYNKEGGRVTLITDDYNDEGLRITVNDNGPGIEELLLSKIFEPFNRLGKEGSNISGTGIGLLISKQLIELMGGTLGVESVLGEGSHFWVDLPHARS